MADYLADVVDWVKVNPYIAAGGVAVLLLLMSGRKSGGTTDSTGLSDEIKSQLIAADLQSQQVAAAARVQNVQTRASLAAVRSSNSAQVQQAQLQANVQRNAINASTTQARIEAATTKNLAAQQYKSQSTLANIYSRLQQALQNSAASWNYQISQMNNEYAKAMQREQLEYQKTQDYWAFKIAKSTAPYVASQNAYLLKKGYSPMVPQYGFDQAFGAQAGNQLGIAVGDLARWLGGKASSYFGSSSGTAAANSAMNDMVNIGAGYGSLF